MAKIPSLQIRLLGELQVLRDGRPLALPASRKTRAVLGYLAATPGQQLRSHLCDLLWDGPDDPRGLLRWSLSRLRRVLGDALQADREHAGIDRPLAAVDLDQLHTSLGDGVERASVAALEAAAALFRGEFLEGLELPGCAPFHAICLARRSALRSLRLAALAELVVRHRECPDAALPHARALLAVDPFSERAHTAVIRICGELGRTREGLDQFEACRYMLREEYGTQPAAALLRARAALGGLARAAAAPTGARFAPMHRQPPRQRRAAHWAKGRADEATASAQE